LSEGGRGRREEGKRERREEGEGKREEKASVVFPKTPFSGSEADY
jgi:hypothetical protein